MVQTLCQTFLSTFVDVFCAYYANDDNFKVIFEIYSPESKKLIKEEEMQDLLEAIQNLLQILSLLSAYEFEEEDQIEDIQLEEAIAEAQTESGQIDSSKSSVKI